MTLSGVTVVTHFCRGGKLWSTNIAKLKTLISYLGTDVGEIEEMPMCSLQF